MTPRRVPFRLEPLPAELTRAQDAAGRLVSALAVLREKTVRGHELEARRASWQRVLEAEVAVRRALERAALAARDAGLEGPS